MPLVDGVPGPHVVVNLWESEHEGRVGLHLPQDDILDGGAGALVGLQVGQLADGGLGISDQFCVAEMCLSEDDKLMQNTTYMYIRLKLYSQRKREADIRYSHFLCCLVSPDAREGSTVHCTDKNTKARTA